MKNMNTKILNPLNKFGRVKTNVPLKLHIKSMSVLCLVSMCKCRVSSICETSMFDFTLGVVKIDSGGTKLIMTCLLALEYN